MASAKRSWAMVIVDHPDGTQTTKVVCYKSQSDDQIVTGLRTATLSDFHDAALVGATREINGILEKVRKSNNNPKRELAFLNTGNGLLLAWTESAVSGLEQDEDIDRALCLVPVAPVAPSVARRVGLTVDEYTRCVGNCASLFPGGGAALVACIEGCSKISGNVSVRPGVVAASSHEAT